jgi:hypothetical protein
MNKIDMDKYSFLTMTNLKTKIYLTIKTITLFVE